jgi:hypothetical protein
MLTGSPTKDESQAVEKHYLYLKDLTEKGMKGYKRISIKNLWIDKLRTTKDIVHAELILNIERLIEYE